MPAGKGRLRRAIEDFMETNPVTNTGRSWWDEVKRRYEETNAVLAVINERYPGVAVGHFLTFTLCMIMYSLFGSEWAISELRAEAAGTPTDDISSFVGNSVAASFRNPAFREAAESIGTFVVDTVLPVLEAEATNPSSDPKEFLRAMHGLMASITIGAGVLDTTIETMTGGQVEAGGRMIEQLYMNLGLGRMARALVRPLVEAGAEGRMKRYYFNMFRPARFSVAELRDLYALGKISRADMVAQAKEEGWRDQDIDSWIDFAFRNLGETDIWQAYHSNQMTHDEASRRLRSLGYSPDDLPLLFDLNKKQDIADAESVTLSTAKTSFKEQLIGEAEFRDILSKLGKIDREIELQVQLIRHQQEEDIKRLTIAELKGAWDVNILTDAEINYWLSKDEYSQQQIDLLLRTWKAGLEPVFLKLNKGTIVGAYVAGVIDRTQAFRKLQQVGFADEDARLELDLAEARSPEAFGRPKPRLSKQLAPGTLSDLLAAAFITPDDMLSYLADLGYSEGDAELLTAAAVLRAEKEPRPLTQSVVERAYVAGVIDRAGALASLVKQDFTPEAAETILQTVEAENPVVFAPESVQALRVPSTTDLVEALRSGIIDEAAYFARMTEAGFDRATANMYLNLAIVSERKGEKTLTAAQILEAYSRDFINRAQGMSKLTSMGYGEADATMLLRFEKSGIEDTEPWKLLLSGALAPEDAFAQLSGMGFTVKEIEGAIAALQGE